MCAGLQGCYSSAPQVFQGSARLENLMPQARELVETVIDDQFGTPTALRCPTTEIIKTGDTRGEIALNETHADQSTISSLATSELDVSIQHLSATPDAVRIIPNLDQQFEYLEKLREQETIPFPEILPAITSKTTEIISQTSEQLSFSDPLSTTLTTDATYVLNECALLYKGQALYRQHCVHCHGMTGDGNGPSASSMMPRPRDYRLGIVKFTSTGPNNKASSADLKHIIQDGVAGTYMPSFKLLPSDELDALVDYVKFLSLRGEVENRLINEVAFEYSKSQIQQRLEDGETLEEIMAAFQDYLLDFFPDIIATNIEMVTSEWSDADDQEVVVAPQTARPDPSGPSLAKAELSSIAHGRELYLTKGQCAACHGDSGRGDGVQTRALQSDAQGNFYDQPGLHDEWGNLTPPRDFRSGVFRGGRKPIDVYRRVHAGIKGTKMPPAGGTLSEAEIWDLVNYVMSLSQKGQMTDNPAPTQSPASQSTAMR